MSNSQTLLMMTLVSVFLVTGQVALKRAVAALAGEFTLLQVFHFLLQPLLWAAMMCMVAATVVWAYVLMHQPLSRVYPLISISYVLMALVAHFFLGETLTTHTIFGTALIVAGIVVMFS